MALVVISASLLWVRAFRIAVTPSLRTLRAELLRLCARIGYSPPAAL
ncbi:capsid protein [Mesorhizobium sp. ES1-4]|nr:capsid protein [Mesorhizobium sp. ES1-4]MBZ9798107.1 capsid protein [Mesorhizobium sp. ES1-4]